MQSVSEQIVHRGNRAWVKGGPSPNPKGRPRTGYALAECIREVAGAPSVMRMLVERVLEVAFGMQVSIDREHVRAMLAAAKAGEPMPPAPERGEVLQPTIAEMQRAWEFLAAWGFQKPAQDVNITASASPLPLDMSRLSPGEIARHEEIMRKAAGLEQGEGPSLARALLGPGAPVREPLPR